MTSQLTIDQQDSSRAQVFLAFYQNSNTSGVIENIAASITDRIRHNSNGLSNGQVLRPVVFIRVDWPWITLPAASVVLAALVLFLTVANSQVHRVPLWKSSLIPFLFHGLEGWTQDDLRGENRQAMSERAETMHTCLQRRRAGEIRFAQVTEE